VDQFIFIILSPPRYAEMDVLI